MTPVIWFRTQKNRFKRTFFAGTRKCPHNLNRPHFAGVYSYECPHKCAAVSAHTHTHTHTHKHAFLTRQFFTKSFPSSLFKRGISLTTLQVSSGIKVRLKTSHSNAANRIATSKSIKCDIFQ